MNLSIKLLGAAIIGAIATYLMNGDSSRKAKAKAVASSAFGWAFGQIAFYVVPALTDSPDETKMAVVCVCCGLSGYLFDRIANISVKGTLAGFEVESSTKKYDASDPVEDVEQK